MDENETMMTNTDEPAAQETRARTRRRGVVAIAALGAVALLVWGGTKVLYATTHTSTNDAFIGGHLVPVSARIGGFVERVNVRENQPVQAGDTVVVLDSAELEQRVAMAEAELAGARAAAGGKGVTGQAQARLEMAGRERAALTAQIAAARAEAERATRDVDRLRELAAREIVSGQQFDAAVAAAAAARARVSALEEQRNAATAGIGTARAGMTAAEARVAAAEAALATARLQLEYAVIVAPSSGLVSHRSVEPGQLLQPGQPLFTIVAEGELWVDANFKETQLSDVAPGATVSLEVDAYRECDARGVVESISGATGSKFALIAPDNATGNFTKVVQRVPVRIRVTRGCGESHPLRPGMSVVVHVAKGEA